MKIGKGTAMLGILGGGLALVLGQLGTVGQKHHKTVETAVELVKENTEIKHSNDTLVATTKQLKQVIKQKDEQIHQLDSIVEEATSTPAGDVAEANALRKALGKDADHVAVSATKSMTGHLLGGAGAIESVFIVKALEERLAPPTINIENLDPAVTVDVVRDTPRQLPAGDIAALNDSFGFGGHNVVLAFKSL